MDSHLKLINTVGSITYVFCVAEVLCVTCLLSGNTLTPTTKVAEIDETERKEFVERILKKHHTQHISFHNYLPKTIHLTSGNFQILLYIVKHDKPFCDGDFIKMDILSESNDLLRDFWKKKG